MQIINLPKNEFHIIGRLLGTSCTYTLKQYCIECSGAYMLQFIQSYI